MTVNRILSFFSFCDVCSADCRSVCCNIPQMIIADFTMAFMVIVERTFLPASTNGCRPYHLIKHPLTKQHLLT